MEAAELYYAKKVKKLKLEVHVDNPAQLLYFNRGYRVTGFRHRYYANGSNAITMAFQYKKSVT
jgi:ribosomal protein S18 acetylase RimI-like enzyme